jgi:hypothetical protein
VKFTFLSFDTELSEIRQKFDETIIVYYKRFLIFMLRIDVKDRSSSEALSFLKSATLDVIMKTFVKELHDDEVRKETIRDLTSAERSLRELCTLTENADRSKKEFRKFMKEENKNRKLKIYKNMIQRTMFKKKIESMLTSYRAESSFD